MFKGVTERGKWTRILEDAERSYEDGDLDSALMMYLLLAEMGVEVAQTNAAYILEQGCSKVMLSCLFDFDKVYYEFTAFMIEVSWINTRFCPP